MLGVQSTEIKIKCKIIMNENKRQHYSKQQGDKRLLQAGKLSCIACALEGVGICVCVCGAKYCVGGTVQ